MKAKHPSKAQQPSLDILTTLPETIICIILCLLPIEEAARTSILSREWRFKWTKIPKLEFSYATVCRSRAKENQLFHLLFPRDLAIARKDMDWRCKLFCIVHQVLLLRQAPIHEFILSTHADNTCFEIDQILLHLLMHHAVKKLTFYFDHFSTYILPSSIFSFYHLTDLHLAHLSIDHKPIFNGFRSLTSLYLKLVRISKKCLLHLLSNCPSLKRLCLFILHEDFDNDEYPNIIELFKCLPSIEHLTTWGYMTELLLSDWVPEELPTSLIHLKYLCITQLGFDNCDGLDFLGLLMKRSPNLEKIKLEINIEDHCAEMKDYSAILEEYSDVCLKHLNELEIKNFRNLKPELDFVKFILAGSPNLKKVILLTWMLDKDKELEMSKVLLRAPRASPVEIVVEDTQKES